MENLLRSIRVWWWRKSYKKVYEYGLMETGFSSTTHDAGQFDFLVESLGGYFNKKIPSVALDIGGGNGALTCRIFDRASYVCILDNSMQAFVNYKASGYGNITKVVGDMYKCPFKEKSFDAIFSYSTFHCIGSEGAAKNMMGDWCKMLKPGGLLYVGDIPERGSLSYILMDASKRTLKDPRQIKYFFGILMNSYFSKKGLADYLRGLGMDVEIIEQSGRLKFHKERFDLKAVKPE